MTRRPRLLCALWVTIATLLAPPATLRFGSSVLPALGAAAVNAASNSASPVEGTDPIDCLIQYQTGEGIYVDVGSEVGLKRGFSGWLSFDGVQTARITVVGVTRNSSFLRLLSSRSANFPSAGDRVSLTFDQEIELEEPEAADLSDTLRDQGDELPPLLGGNEDVDVNVVVTDPKNVFHGTLTLRQFVQQTSDDDLDFSRTQLRSSGSLERVDGTPWSLEWSGELGYRAGDGLRDVNDFEQTRAEVYRLQFSRRFDDESTLRIGRFIPRELPSVGYIDGVHAEKVVSEGFRYGGVLGLKPFRDDLDVSGDEPTVVPYFTWLRRGGTQSEYSATAGMLLSAYEGDFDRAALLVDQHGRSGRLFFYSSSEVDFDTGSQETRDGVRLTRLDVSLNYQLPVWTPRIGVDRFERPDIEAERDLVNQVVLLEPAFFEDGFWRYWAGSNLRLSQNCSFDAEVSYVDPDETPDAFRWSASFTKRNFWNISGASASLTVYNLENDEQEGFGGRISAYLPVARRGIILQPSVSFRMIDFNTGGEDFAFADVSLRANWRLSSSWTIFGAASYSDTDDEQRGLLEIGITLRW